MPYPYESVVLRSCDLLLVVRVPAQMRTYADSWPRTGRLQRARQPSAPQRSASRTQS